MENNEINYTSQRETRQGVEINQNSPEVLTNNIYTLLRAIESGVLTYADIYSIKFVTISPYPVPRATMTPHYY